MAKQELIDIGVNLTDSCYESDREDVISRAISAGVSVMIVTGSSEKNCNYAVHLAKKHRGVLYATAGIHPHNARFCKRETMEFLRQMAYEKEIVALGECGLDYNRNFSPREVQDRWFDEQIALACELKMPLFLHERDASQRFTAILDRYEKSLPPVVVHCFTGSAGDMEAYLSRNYYIGITGWICDERRGQHLSDLVKKIPLNRLMLETDAPYLTPRNMNEKPLKRRNEPAFLTYVLSKIAYCLGKSPDEVAEATTKNAKAFFKI